MEKRVAVSVIIPIYNTEKYLQDCLDSIEKQTLNDIEVILVNDGSTDGSEIIANEYCQRNNNFKLINQKNAGLSAARNAGIDEAHGEYVYFLDSDDYIAEDAIETLYSKAEKENLDILKFPAYIFEEDHKDYVWLRKTGYLQSGLYPDVYNGLQFYKQIIRNNDYDPSCCLIFIKKSLIDDRNVRFLHGVIHEDNLFFFEIITLCERIGVLNKPLYYRRIRNESITQRVDLSNTIRSFCLISEEADKFIDHNPQIQGFESNWQMAYYINTMLSYRMMLPIRKQYSKEVRGYFDRVKKFISKYGTEGNKSLKVYYYSFFLYRMIRMIRNIGINRQTSFMRVKDLENRE